MNYCIGKNKFDNNTLFDLAQDHHTWFHIAHESSAHMWLSTNIKELSKNELYTIALQLKKKSKFAKVNGIEIIYAKKTELQKTNVIGQIVITGKSKIIRV